MKRELGFFTCYGIEYVYDFLGKGKIDNRIVELKDKPTMGTPLNRFTYGDPEYSYYGSTGVLHLFSMIIHLWFSDINFLNFLLKSSKKYNKENYFEGGLLKNKWQENLDQMDRMIERNPESIAAWENNKTNPFWKEYHFFYSQLFKKMITQEMIDDYLKNFNEISVRIKQDVEGINPSAGNVLTNGCLWEIHDYYENKGDHIKADEIAKLNNSCDVWRSMPEYEEEGF